MLVDLDFHSACPPLYTNLGGSGPNTSYPQQVLYRGAGTVGGRSVDVVLRNTSYMPPCSSGSECGRCNGQFGLLSQRRSSRTRYEIEFVDTATGDPVTLLGLRFTFFDIDGGSSSWQECISVCGYDEYHVENGTYVDVTRRGCGLEACSSDRDPVGCVGGAACNNPSDPSALTVEQMKRSVGLYFTNVSSFQFEASSGQAGGLASGGAAILFAFSSSMFEACPPPPSLPLPALTSPMLLDIT